MVHGNVHPGTIMISDDGRVVLADARTDGADSQASDIRAVGGVLYFALTGHWPHAEVPLHGATAGHGRASTPDAVRGPDGALAAPRQVRAGVPAYLDDLTMDLLDGSLTPPPSDVLAAELARLDIPADEHFLESNGPLRFTAETGDEPSPLAAAGGRKFAVGIASLLAVALVGLLIGISVLSKGGDSERNPATAAAPSANATAGEDPPATAAAEPPKISAAKIIDPDSGDRVEVRDAEKVFDGSVEEGWATQTYRGHPNFGNIKRGMGIWLDLGEPRTVQSLQVQLSARGASAQLYTGTNEHPSSKAGDDALLEEYEKNPIGPPKENADTTMVFDAFDADTEYQYLLFWLTELPPSDGGYKVGVEEITVS